MGKIKKKKLPSSLQFRKKTILKIAEEHLKSFSFDFKGEVFYWNLYTGVINNFPNKYYSVMCLCYRNSAGSYNETWFVVPKKLQHGEKAIGGSEVEKLAIDICKEMKGQLGLQDAFIKYYAVVNTCFLSLKSHTTSL